MKVNSKIRISVITINLNNGDGLQKTINTVISQTYPNIEYIIIDGGSNDNSINVIEKSSSNISLWRSESDGGIYEAMNKGVGLSTGDYLTFLNSGDCFFSPESVELFVSENQDCDIAYGDLEIIESDRKWIKTYPSKLSFSYFWSESLPHPSTFIKKTLFESVGLYETNMEIASDWAFFMKAICLQNVNYKHLPYTISSFKYDGISSLPENQQVIAEEKMAYLRNKFPLFVDDYLEMEEIRGKHNYLKASSLRKFLAFFFKALHI